ncbi:MAG: thymidine phosphorylase [Ruminococcaceae bacterium]|nr:thymidine phosphorylase [Oscillospiraceae bacterium]
MRMYDLIEKKKRAGELTKDEIFAMIRAYTKGDIPDYQMSAFCMAVWFNGMTDRETFDLTEAMALSGDTVDLSQFGDRSVDKHSTGGVGDKTTLIVAPIVATCGGIVAKMSGRGLGHTGGTVDKLESFEGFKTSLSPEDFTAQVEKIGLAVIGQSGDLAPADKKMYALRDVTATVDTIPLIAASIMSKKLAAGTHSIVLDVKCGSGAFMRTPEDASELAGMMVKIGRAHNRNIAAVITNMNIPLGHAIGNVLEVKEAVEVLKGRGPDDLREICLTLASAMVKLSCGVSIEKAKEMTADALLSGRAYDTFCRWIEAQGGEKEKALDPELFGIAEHTYDIVAERDCYFESCNTEMIGTAAMMLGAGRATADDIIDPRAGIILHKKPSDKLKKGDVIATLHTERPATIEAAAKTFESALQFTDNAVERQPLVFNIIGLD